MILNEDEIYKGQCWRINTLPAHTGEASSLMGFHRWFLVSTRWFGRLNSLSHQIILIKNMDNLCS